VYGAVKQLFVGWVASGVDVLGVAPASTVTAMPSRAVLPEYEDGPVSIFLTAPDDPRPSWLFGLGSREILTGPVPFRDSRDDTRRVTRGRILGVHEDVS